MLTLLVSWKLVIFISRNSPEPKKMAQDVPLDRLDIPNRVLASLKKAKITLCSHLLSKQDKDLQRLMSADEVESLRKKVVSLAISKPSKGSAYDVLLRQQDEGKLLTTGCPLLDSLLRGGLPVGSVVEIAGESASGKTQLCLQCSLTAQLPRESGGLGSGVAYISTEYAFPIKRLNQLIQHFGSRHQNVPTNLSDNVYISQIGDSKSLLDCMKMMLPKLMEARNVKLVILDSVAAIFRSEYEQEQAFLRALELKEFGHLLHSLARKYEAVILCVNQVTSVPQLEECSSSVPWSLGESVIPSLGLTWSNIVTTRLMLSRTAMQVPKRCKGGQPNTVRCCQVVFAPHVPPSNCYFLITEDGIKGIQNPNAATHVL